MKKVFCAFLFLGSWASACPVFNPGVYVCKDVEQGYEWTMAPLSQSINSAGVTVYQSGEVEFVADGKLLRRDENGISKSGYVVCDRDKLILLSLASRLVNGVQETANWQVSMEKTDWDHYIERSELTILKNDSSTTEIRVAKCAIKN